MPVATKRKSVPSAKGGSKPKRRATKDKVVQAELEEDLPVRSAVHGIRCEVFPTRRLSSLKQFDCTVLRVHRDTSPECSQSIKHLRTSSFGFLTSERFVCPTFEQEESGEEEEVDDIPCESCGSKDAENMLLCDGCDAGYHTQCLRPALTAVPEGDWYCSKCQAEGLGTPAGKSIAGSAADGEVEASNQVWIIL